MLVLRYWRVGPPCATGLSGRAGGCGGMELGRVEAPAGVAMPGAIVDRCSGIVDGAGVGTGAASVAGAVAGVGS